MQGPALRLNWPLIRRVLITAFFLAVVVLIVSQARKIQWAQVGTAVRSYRAVTLLQAELFTMLAYSVYSCFDLISKRCVRSPLSAPRTLAIAAISYAFNQNFGYLVGGLAFRFRLYSRFGLETAQISRIVGLGVLTNWLGYSLLAGTVFAVGRVRLPDHWKLGPQGLRVLGCALLLAAIAYLIYAMRSHRARFGKMQVELPQAGALIAQIVLSIAHWLLTACVIWTLLRGEIDYFSVLGTMLLASVAAVATHIPAGIGVLEAVFLNVLAGRMPSNELLAGVLVYRAIYHLLPLSIAGLSFIAVEAQARRIASPANTNENRPAQRAAEHA